MYVQIGVLGHVLVQLSVGILASAALPRTVRIVEVDLDAGSKAQFIL